MPKQKNYSIANDIIQLRKKEKLSEVQCAKILRVTLPEYHYIEQGNNHIEPTIYQEIYETLKTNTQ